MNESDPMTYAGPDGKLSVRMTPVVEGSVLRFYGPGTGGGPGHCPKDGTEMDSWVMHAFGFEGRSYTIQGYGHGDEMRAQLAIHDPRGMGSYPAMGRFAQHRLVGVALAHEKSRRHPAARGEVDEATFAALAREIRELEETE